MLLSGYKDFICFVFLPCLYVSLILFSLLSKHMRFSLALRKTIDKTVLKSTIRYNRKKIIHTTK